MTDRDCILRLNTLTRLFGAIFVACLGAAVLTFSLSPDSHPVLLGLAAGVTLGLAAVGFTLRWTGTLLEEAYSAASSLRRKEVRRG